MEQVLRKPRRIKRGLLVAAIVLVTALAGAAFLFPYLLKRYIERNSVAWIDRQVRIGSILLNPFTGTYAVHGLVCHEPRDTTVFVRFSKLGVKGDVLHGLRSGHWHFHDAELRDPYFRIVQRGDRFNFNDLLELGDDTPGPAPDTSATDVAFAVEGIALTGGRIDYISDVLHEPLQVIDLEAHCTRITSGDARMDFTVGLGLPEGTRLDGAFMIDTDQELYAVHARLRDLLLAGSLPYLRDFFDAGVLAGALDLDLNVQQSYADTTGLALSARLDLRGLDLRDPDMAPLLAVQHLHARLDTLVGDRFELGRIDIRGADARFALLPDSTDNWTRLLKLVPDSSAAGDGEMVLDASESNYFVLLADYVRHLGQAFTASEYAADSLAFSGGRILFEDHSIPRGLKYEITELGLHANRFTTGQDRAPITASATLQQVGRLRINADFDPRDLRNVALRVQLDSLLLPPLDPYVRWYAAHPMQEGVLAFSSATDILNGRIDSQNRLHVDRLRFGRKVDEHAPDMPVLPLRLAAGMLKDAKGVVELEVPVQGDLNDPLFRVWPIVWQVLKNLVVKAASAPVNLLARLVEGADERDLELVRYAPLQVQPQREQRRALEQLAKLLAAKPDLRVDLVPVADSIAEAGDLALFTAQGRFLFAGQAELSAADSARIHALAEQDSTFLGWLDQQLPGSAHRPVRERAIALVGHDAHLSAWRALERSRLQQAMAALQAAGVAPERMRARPGTPQEVAAYQGAPGYRFVYDLTEEE